MFFAISVFPKIGAKVEGPLIYVALPVFLMIRREYRRMPGDEVDCIFIGLDDKTWPVIGQVSLAHLVNELVGATRRAVAFIHHVRTNVRGNGASRNNAVVFKKAFAVCRNRKMGQSGACCYNNCRQVSYFKHLFYHSQKALSPFLVDAQGEKVKL